MTGSGSSGSKALRKCPLWSKADIAVPVGSVRELHCHDASRCKAQGSCCAPMDESRYRQQSEGLRKYSDITEVPPDPYDIPAPLAHKLMGDYDLVLNKEEQAAYDYAMQHSDMEGPCCCKCWRWKVYGGLGKLLI